jgi:hypothetical protein
MITGWFLELIGAHAVLDFQLNVDDPQFRKFIRKSHAIYHLYEEDHADAITGDIPILSVPNFPYFAWWNFLHMFGALSYL